jgi:phenylalanyl-tRNA synthetase alpha subunit
VIDQLNELEQEAVAALGSATDAASIEAWRVTYLGSKGRLKGLMPLMKDVPKDQKGAAGKRLNEVKSALEQAFEAARPGPARAAGAPVPRRRAPRSMSPSQGGRRRTISAGGTSSAA